MPPQYAQKGADPERRLGNSAVAMVTGINECDGAVRDAERRIGERFGTMTDDVRCRYERRSLVRNLSHFAEVTLPSKMTRAGTP
jgi:hypothetical protein